MWRSSSARTRLRASSFCPSAGSSRGHSPGSIVAEGWPRIGNVSTERRSPSSVSPPSASCYENSAIQDNVPGQTLILYEGRGLEGGKEDLWCREIHISRKHINLRLTMAFPVPYKVEFEEICPQA